MSLNFLHLMSHVTKAWNTPCHHVDFRGLGPYTSPGRYTRRRHSDVTTLIQLGQAK